MIAARFSAINSRNAALHLVERSEGESQESLLDDRRERAHPPDNYIKTSPTINTLYHQTNFHLSTLFPSL